MWNHNSHFHPYLLRQLPKKVEHALDVGCGLGFFACKLAEYVDVVDALDIDGKTLAEAESRKAASNISYLEANFLEAELPEASYDAIVSIASLHHMDLESALGKMKRLLRPHGKLIILGLSRDVTLIDYGYSVFSIPINLAYLRWHPGALENSETTAPTCTAQLSLRQIRSMAESLIPEFRLRRHLFWRYSLVWQKP
ncbi:class I SAM-dependent methyltransferase [Acaryochloris sp. IP29b_bin.137]|uniref:class I SAM-dependent methyltransferase n=1 Tax=Acaryochloris sp. IP29b_bin.137 TaxID=2969217 RepID=UPI00263624B1|nr:class I SAM-dependent methyltransferase [Acaryochloris sp. IP29b_bin.137]